jgi:hypothetical protein
MEFNVKKCKVMHLGFNNPGHIYSMNNQQLATTEDKRDIGVCVSKNLKPSAQCAQAAKTAQTVLSQLTRAFQYRDRVSFLWNFFISREASTAERRYRKERWSENYMHIGAFSTVKRGKIGHLLTFKSKLKILKSIFCRFFLQKSLYEL